MKRKLIRISSIVLLVVVILAFGTHCRADRQS